MSRLLIVEDEAAIRVLLRDLLYEEEKFHVIEAQSGEDAIALLRRETPDLALIDLVMPGIAGTEVARQAAACGIPVLLMTGKMMAEEELDDLGFPCIRKPFRLADLIEWIRRLLAEAPAPPSSREARYRLDGNSRFTFVNPTAEALWGKSSSELLGRYVWEVFPQAVGSHCHAMHLKAISEGRPCKYETVSPVFHRPIEVTIRPLSGGLLVSFHEIAEGRNPDREQHERADGGEETSACRPWSRRSGARPRRRQPFPVERRTTALTASRATPDH